MGQQVQQRLVVQDLHLDLSDPDYQKDLADQDCHSVQEAQANLLVQEHQTNLFHQMLQQNQWHLDLRVHPLSQMVQAALDHLVALKVLVSLCLPLIQLAPVDLLAQPVLADQLVQVDRMHQEFQQFPEVRLFLVVHWVQQNQGFPQVQEHQ